MHSADIKKENSIDESMVQQYFVVCGTIVFFFLRHLQSFFGKLLRALVYLVIAMFVIYMTADMQNQTLVTIIRVVVSVIVAFTVYVDINNPKRYCFDERVFINL